jgi:small subunit ribosomal protein S10
LVDNSAEKIVKAVKSTGATVSGPIPLPTRIEKFTVLKSTFVNKNARDQYEMRTHTRLIDIKETTPQTIDSLTNLTVPAGVDIEIKMLVGDKAENTKKGKKSDKSDDEITREDEENDDDKDIYMKEDKEKYKNIKFINKKQYTYNINNNDVAEWLESMRNVSELLPNNLIDSLKMDDFDSVRETITDNIKKLKKVKKNINMEFLNCKYINYKEILINICKILYVNFNSSPKYKDNEKLKEKIFDAIKEIKTMLKHLYKLNKIRFTSFTISFYSYSANTASGQAAFVGGGWGNNATSNASTVTGGQNNTANSLYSTVVGGAYGTTRSIWGNIVFPASANPLSSPQGASQAALLILAKQTTDATASVLTTDAGAGGTSNQVILPNNSAYFFKGEVIAGVTGGGNTKGWTIEGVIKRGANAASTTVVGVTVMSSYGDAGAVTWTIAAAADTTNGGLKITATGQAATTIRWVCKIETTEMTY